MSNVQLKVCPAKAADLPEILRIFQSARAFMRSRGNYHQWVNGYPSEELLREDIEKEQLFVICRGDAMCGVFAFIIGNDPAYEVIEDGRWICDSEYGTIHRIGGDGTAQGILRTAVEYAARQIGHLRIDTHEDNLPMQRAVLRNGFIRCGTIYLEDGSPRIAYEKVNNQSIT